MNISLNNDLAVFDLEATGLSVTKDRIVEIAVLKIEPDGTQTEFHRRINPQMAIPNESSEIHGIYDKDIQDAPTFKEIVQELEDFLGNADVAGFNSNKFDLPLLAEELIRAESTYDLSQRKHIDVQNIFHKMEQRTLIAAYKFYCNKELIDAHNASSDVAATWEVLDAQIGKYDELQNNVSFLSEFSRYQAVSRIDFAGRLALDEEGNAIYNFGKHKGKTIKAVSELEPGYYGWMMDADFPLYTKQCLRNEMEKIKRERRQKESRNYEAKIDALKNKFK